MEPIEKDDHFIPDGMNAFERNVKRIGDCILALGALIVFSPLRIFFGYRRTCRYRFYPDVILSHADFFCNRFFQDVTKL